MEKGRYSKKHLNIMCNSIKLEKIYHERLYIKRGEINGNNRN